MGDKGERERDGRSRACGGDLVRVRAGLATKINSLSVWGNSMHALRLSDLSQVSTRCANPHGTEKLTFVAQVKSVRL